MVQQNSPHVWKKQIISFAEQLDLPGMFSDLKIRGLDKVASSHELSARNKELIFRFLNHISPEISERRLTFYTHKLRRMAGWLKIEFTG